jgi:hypothetical protein
MTDCVRSQDGTCSTCGRSMPEHRIRRMCGKAPPSLPGQAVAYVSAVARWIAAGRPTRSQGRIDEILTTICDAKPVPCEHFRSGSCDLCGCKINANPSALRNKLAMGTESCPLDLPRWTAEP